MSLEPIASKEPTVVNALFKYKHEVFKDGALTAREKELIALAISCVLKCENCAEMHAAAAERAGATKDQLREAMTVALYLGGPPSLVFSTTIDALME